MMRTCSACKIEKPLIEFHFKVRSKGLRHSWCKQCHKQYRDKLYRKRRDIYKKNARERKRRVALEYRVKIVEFLSAHPCVDCGESDPVVLEFDHARGEKLFSVGRQVASAGSWSKILSEIEKCEVRCCNCHRRKTARERGWHNGLVA